MYIDSTTWRCCCQELFHSFLLGDVEKSRRLENLRGQTLCLRALRLADLPICRSLPICESSSFTCSCHSSSFRRPPLVPEWLRRAYRHPPSSLRQACVPRPIHVAHWFILRQTSRHGPSARLGKARFPNIFAVFATIRRMRFHGVVGREVGSVGVEILVILVVLGALWWTWRRETRR